MRHIQFTLILLLSGFAVHAQDLIKGLRKSPYTYIFSLSNEEAARAHKDQLKYFDPAYADIVVDSFPTGKFYPKKLPHGNYLFAHAEEEKLLLSLESVHNVSLNLLPDARKLVAAVYDENGALIKNANVSLQGKKLRFHPGTNTYQRRYKGPRKLLIVEHAGLQNFFYLEQGGFSNSLSRRALRKVIYFKPVYVLWSPFQDVVRTIRWGGLHGWLRIFDPYEWEERFEKEDFGGYVALNQPLYRQSDTVHFKAFVLKNNRPFKKPLEVEISGETRNGYKSYTLNTLSPYRDGAYEGYFVLHDSLGFLQNTYPTLHFTRRNRSLRQQFKQEDYELKGNTFSLRASRNAHVQGAPPLLMMRGIDVNGLSLLGAEVQLVAVADQVNTLMGKSYVLLPDTLWRHKLTLQPVGDTQLQLPDSIFQNIGLSYKLYASLRTPQQEYLKQELSMQYMPNAMIDMELSGDSLLIRYLQEGNSVPQQAQISIYQKMEDPEERMMNLPARIKIDPLWVQVEVWTDKVNEILQLYEKPALVEHAYSRTADSLLLSLSSGRKIPYWYTLYSGKRKKKKLATGYSNGEPVFLARKASGSKTYFLQLNWVWAGKVEQAQADIPLLKKMLKLEVEAPDQVKPGEKLEIGVQVTDAAGKPVEGVDLTALSYNKKMPGTIDARVPYLGKERWLPLSLRERRLSGWEVKANKDLDCMQWQQRLGLDSIAFYQFLYPRQKLYTYTLPTPDASTQFAPYVVEKGVPQQVHIVYLNDIPIYYSEVEAQRAYSFRVDPPKTYKLKLRTATHLYTFDKICFDQGQKSILSLGKEMQQPGVRVEKMLPTLSQQELNHLNEYLIVVNHAYNQQYAYIAQDGQLQLLSAPVSYNSSRQLLAGPFRPASTTYEVMGEFKTEFPLETAHKYRIKPGLVFAKSIKPEWDKWLEHKREHPKFGEMAFNEEHVGQLWKHYLEQQNRLEVKYEYPSRTQAGAGRIALRYAKEVDNQQQDEAQEQETVFLQEVVVLSLQDTAFIQVYPVKKGLKKVQQLLHNLPPGTYKLLGLLSDQHYLQIDSLPVLANTTTHLDLQQLPLLMKDEYVEQIRKTIENSLSARVMPANRIQQELKHINQVARLERPGPGGYTLQGRITDQNTEEGIPGVAVRIKGTPYGTVTDLDGNFQISADPGDELEFSFIGYRSYVYPVEDMRSIEVRLQEDVEQLSEVVVVGYGVKSKRALTAAVSHVLSGRVSGVMISGAPGNGTTIRIRGASSITAEHKPLIVIDGVIYDGDLSKLDASLVSSAIVLKGAEATSIYGSRAAGGVLLITSGKPGVGTKKENPLLGGGAGQENTLRTNFRDWAFWQPRLNTDSQGRARFTVSFPDNITAWEAKWLAMGKKRYSGQTDHTIRAVKPLWASMAYPRFLLTGDSSMVYGQVNNYSSDTLDISTRFTFGALQQPLRNSVLTASRLDSAWVSTSSNDSLTLTYEVLGQEGLLDGERRKLPVYRRGVREARGEFFMLRPDSARNLANAAGEGDWQLQAFASTRGPLLSEIRYLMDYPYYCNEQAASKLYALLVHNQLRQEQDKFPQKHFHIKKLIRQLVSAQHKDGSWGWWQGNSGETWITRHVAGALQMAKEAGYDVDFDTEKLLESLDWQLKGSRYPYEQLGVLEVLAQLKATAVPYLDYIQKLEENLKEDEVARLRLLRLRANTGFASSFTAADVLALKHETILGSYYWGHEKSWNPEHTSLIATAWAYDLLRQKGAVAEMDKAALYLWENRPNGYWRNTYESAQVLLQLVPNMPLQEEHKPSFTLEANGANTQYEEIPFLKPLSLAADQLVLKNTGNTPVYLSAYTESWIEKPAAVAGDFAISTRFSGDKKQLKVGETVEMIAEVEVKKAAEYVMIEIPIPSGCTYDTNESSVRNWGEIHREYFRDRVVIFCRRLPEGKHTYKVNLQPRFKGTYALNPAQVSLMYFPTIFGRAGMQQVEIR